MVNYKKITDVESVSSTTETMNVLVEDNGSLKKVPAANMGVGSGSIGGIFVLTGITDSYGNTTYSANMTYEELRNAIANNEIIWGIIQNSYETGASYDSITYLDIYENSIEIVSTTDANSSAPHLPYYEFASDGTITYEESPGLGGGM